MANYKLTLAQRVRVLELPDELTVEEVTRLVNAHAEIMKEYADVEWHLMKEDEQ